MARYAKDDELRTADNSAADGDYQVKTSKAVDILMRIGAVLIAFVLWLYAMNTDSPTYESNIYGIPVSVENLSQAGLSLMNASELTVDVKVVGKRSVVQRLSTDDFDAYIDLSTVTGAGRYSFEINIVAPSGVNILEKTPGSSILYLDETTSMSIPVRARFRNYQLESGYELGEAQVNPSEIVVVGPTEILKTLEFAQASWDLGYVTGPMDIKCGLELIDTSGEVVKSPYITMQTTEASVKVPVYVTKTVPINVASKNGFFNDSNVKITVEPSSVTLRGESDEMELISSIDITVDEKKIIADTLTQTLSLPEGVENLDGVDSVKMTFSHIGTTTAQLSVPVNVRNPAGNDYTLLSTSINIRFRGTSELLTAMTADDVSVVADLSHLSNVVGTTAVPVTVELSEEYAGKVYELGEYTASVAVEAD